MVKVNRAIPITTAKIVLTDVFMTPSLIPDCSPGSIPGRRSSDHHSIRFTPGGFQVPSPGGGIAGSPINTLVLPSSRLTSARNNRLGRDTLFVIFCHQIPDVHSRHDLLEETMRTTVDLEEDVLLAAKEIAKRRGETLGQVLSDLARQALTRRTPVSTKHGLPLFPVRPDAGVVTLELVNNLRDETP
jgi:hypothetical protein